MQYFKMNVKYIFILFAYTFLSNQVHKLQCTSFFKGHPQLQTNWEKNQGKFNIFIGSLFIMIFKW